jgi:uncharacterized protein
MRWLMQWRVWAAAVLFGLALYAGAAGVDIPPLKTRVTDSTGTLSAQNIARLEQKLAAFEQEKGVQVAVLMVPTVQPESIEEYAVRVFERWKLGRKRVDDGVLLIVAKDDRKLRIEVGYGLEGVLNDATAKRIISDDIVPHFKHGDFAAGVDAGVSRILRVAGGEPLPPPVQQGQGHSAPLPFDPMLLFATFIFANPLARMLRPLTGRVPAAALIGLAVGVGIGLVFASLLAGLAAGVIIFVISLLEGSSGGSWGGGGGDSWSSSNSGGFGGGGGFSGGGGSSGGGGASGSW